MFTNMTEIMPNAGDKLLTMGDLYYCTDTVDFSTLLKLTTSNHSTVKAALDALTYATVGHINDFNISHSLQNEEIIRVGNCGVGEIAALSQITPTINFTWLDVNNRPVFDKMLGLDRLNVAASEVTGATFVIPTGFSYNKFYPIPNQNGAGTANTITGVVGSVNAGPLVANTDYVLTQSGGVRGILILDSATVTTTAQTITVTYNHTPSASVLDGYNIQKKSIPYGIYKFVSCKNPTSDSVGIQDTIYFVKYKLSADLVEQYVDLSGETNFAGVSASFVGVQGGMYLKAKATVSL